MEAPILPVLTHSRHFLLTSAHLCLKKFTQRVARLISGQLVGLKVMSEISDRRLKRREVKRVIGVRINDELDRDAFTLLSRNTPVILPVHQLSTSLCWGPVITFTRHNERRDRHGPLDSATNGIERG